MDIQDDKDFAALPEVAKLYQACKERDLTITEREYLKGARDAWQAKAQAVPEGFVEKTESNTHHYFKLKDWNEWSCIDGVKDTITSDYVINSIVEIEHLEVVEIQQSTKYGLLRFAKRHEAEVVFFDSLEEAQQAQEPAKAQAVPEGFVLVKDKPVAYMVQNNFWKGEFEVKLSSEMPEPEFKGDSYDIEIQLYAIETQEPANTDLTAEFQTWFKTQPFYEKLIYQYGDRLFDRDGEVYRAQPVDIAYRAYRRTPGNE